MASLTIEQRLQKQREFRSYLYALRLVMDKSGDRMEDFKFRAGQRDEEWKLKIWKIRNQIMRGEL